jgi:hypothetical protein
MFLVFNSETFPINFSYFHRTFASRPFGGIFSPVAESFDRRGRKFFAGVGNTD